MFKTDIIIPFWKGSSSNEINDSLGSLKNELELIDNIIIVCDGKDSFFKFFIEDNSFVEKILIIYLFKNCGAGNARNIGAKYSRAENLIFLDAGDICINMRITTQINTLRNHKASFAFINEYSSTIKNRIRKGCLNLNQARWILPYKSPFNNVTLAIRRKLFFDINGYGNTRLGEDWILIAKILNFTSNIKIETNVLVLVNIKDNFLKRRRGAYVYREIKDCLKEIYNLKLINKYQMYISIFVQKVTRVYLPDYILSLIYYFNRS